MASPAAFKIRELLEKRGWTVTQLAREAGVYQSSLWRFMAGATEALSVHVAARVSAALDGEVKVRELVWYHGHPFPKGAKW